MIYLLCVDINTREPAAKARMTVIPPYHHLWPVHIHTRLVLVEAGTAADCASWYAS